MGLGELDACEAALCAAEVVERASSCWACERFPRAAHLCSLSPCHVGHVDGRVQRQNESHDHRQRLLGANRLLLESICDCFGLDWQRSYPSPSCRHDVCAAATGNSVHYDHRNVVNELSLARHKVDFNKHFRLDTMARSGIEQSDTPTS
jgi:hypothetical protein